MPLTEHDLLAQVALGEDSSRQFKADIHNAESLAAEMAAFANSDGGTIFIGVTDHGSAPGLSREAVARINQLISNAASQLVRSPLAVLTENVLLANGSLVIALTVPKGLDKPYFDKNGIIWLKAGSDKRRVNSKEELRRLFQLSSQFHADELPTKAGIDKLDRLRFRDFLHKHYTHEYPEKPEALLRLLQNMNLVTETGLLNLASVLMFTERPEWIVPQFVVKAIRYPGNEIHSSDYVDTEDFSGPLRTIFENSQAFIMRNLHKVQAGQGVNAPGIPEIPPAVFEELLVNALIHRDYLVSAAIRIFVFDNRIEIISPGHLPNNLTVEKIKEGNSNIRNPILISYVAKGLLPYHGLGSGIHRALENWPHIDFVNDHDGCLFKATVRRNTLEELALIGDIEPFPPNISGENSGESSRETSQGSGETLQSSGEMHNGSGKISEGSGKSSGKIIEIMQLQPTISIPEIAAALGISTRAVEKHIANLRKTMAIRRVGPTKGGKWEVLG